MAFSIARGSKGRATHYTVDTDDKDGLVSVLDPIDASNILEGAAAASGSSAAPGPVPLTAVSTLPAPIVFESGSDGWNKTKNVFVDGKFGGYDIIELNDYVHVDVDLSGDTSGGLLDVNNAKRGNIALGSGDDALELSLVTNGSGWSNRFVIDTGRGADDVTITAGEARYKSDGHKTQATITDGRHTTVEADLGDGDDTYENHTIAADVVKGGDGDDRIDAGGGDDEIHDGAGTDILIGGAGDDTFVLTDSNAFGDNGIHYDNAREKPLKGGEGHDIVDATGAEGPVTIADLIFMDASIEEFHGSAHGDEVNAMRVDHDVTFYGNSGNDSFKAGRGDDHAEGGEGDDTFNGGAGQNTYIGGAGNDKFYNFTDDDVIEGGEGVDLVRWWGNRPATFHMDTADVERAITGSGTYHLRAQWSDVGVSVTSYGDTTVIGSDHADEMSGFGGVDTFHGRGGDDKLNGRGGEDVIHGGDGQDKLDGGGGNDTVAGGAGQDKLDGGGGDDSAFGGEGNDVVEGGDGNDILRGDQDGGGAASGDGDDTIDGGAGNDTIGGQGGDDEIDGGTGDDRLFGSHGDDTILGGEGDDEVYGNHDDDSLSGGAGNDTLGGSTGTDTLDGGEGDDSAVGGEGNDVVKGGDGNDILRGDQDGGGAASGDGDDTIDGGAGNDTIGGQGGNDEIDGGTGDDRLWGSHGNDTVYGSDGADMLNGGVGDDEIDGGAGDDEIIADDGDDVLTGGEGGDTFSFGDGKTGDNVITDLSFAEGDVIRTDKLHNDGFATFGDLEAFVEANAANGYAMTENDEGTGFVVDFGTQMLEAVLAPSALNVLSAGHSGYVNTGGADLLVGDDTDNKVTTTHGTDWLYGGGGNDALNGYHDDDYLFGQAGNDKLSGGHNQHDADVFFGGDGDDAINPDHGSDIMFGGAGADTFSVQKSGSDDVKWILDFEEGIDTLGLQTVGLMGGGVSHGWPKIETAAEAEAFADKFDDDLVEYRTLKDAFGTEASEGFQLTFYKNGTADPTLVLNVVLAEELA